METTSGVRVARGATYLLLQGVVANISMIIFFSVSARLLPTVADMGFVAALSMLSTFFSTVSTFAIPSALTKYVAEYMGKGRMAIAKGVYRAGLKVGIVAAILSFIACFVGAPFLAKFLIGDSSKAHFIQLLAFDVAPITLTACLICVLYGLQNFRVVFFAYAATRPVTLAITFLLLFKGIGIVGILIGWIVGDYLHLVLISRAIYSSFKSTTSISFSLKPLVNYSLPLYGSTVLGYFSSTIDRYLVLRLAGASVLGIYSPVATAAGLVNIVSYALGNALFPQLAEMHGRSGKAALKSACRSACRYTSILYMPLALGLAITAVPTITLFVGQRYSPGAPALAIIASASAVTCLGVVIGYILLSIGETRIFFVTSIVAIISDAAFCFLLVEKYGSVGAAIARASLILVLFIIPTLRLRSIMGLDIDYKAYFNVLLSSLAMVFAVFSAELYFANNYALPLYVLVGGAVYFLMLRLLKVLNPDDMMLLSRFLPSNTRIVKFITRFLVSK